MEKHRLSKSLAIHIVSFVLLTVLVIGFSQAVSDLNDASDQIETLQHTIDYLQRDLDNCRGDNNGNATTRPNAPAPAPVVPAPSNPIPGTIPGRPHDSGEAGSEGAATTPRPDRPETFDPNATRPTLLLAGSHRKHEDHLARD